MVDGTIEFSFYVLSFAADLNAFHHAALQWLSGVGVGERLQNKPALVVPFAEWTVEEFVAVAEFRSWTLFAMPLGEGAIDADGFDQLPRTVPVDVLKLTVFEVEFPAPFLCAVQIRALAQPSASAVVRLEGAVQGAAAVSDALAKEAVVVPGVPFAVHFAVVALSTLAHCPTGEVPFFKSVLHASVVMHGRREVAFGRKQRPNPVTRRRRRAVLEDLGFQGQGRMEVPALCRHSAIRSKHSRVGTGRIVGSVDHMGQSGAVFSEIPPTPDRGAMEVFPRVVEGAIAVHAHPFPVTESGLVGEVVVDLKRSRRPCVFCVQRPVVRLPLRSAGRWLRPHARRERQTKHAKQEAWQNSRQERTRHGTKMRLVVDEAPWFGYFCSPKPFYS